MPDSLVSVGGPISDTSRARLTVALGVTLTDDGLPLDGTAGLLLTPRKGPEPAIAVGPRIGVGKARDFPLRFWVVGDPTVSRPC